MLSASRKKWFSGLLITALMAVGLLSQMAYGFARGYTTSDTGLQTGMVVSLNPSDGSNSVERATQATSGLVVGVVTTLDDTLLATSTGESQLLVENDGQVDAYVSDINGSVQEGDQLVVSQLKGILMKSGSGITGVIATAVETPADSSSYSYQDGEQTRETKISKVRVNLEHKVVTSTTINDSALSRLGRQITGKTVGEIRLVLAMFIFLVVLIAEGGILYGAISGALTALGRNPLAKKTIRQELFRVIVIAIVVLGVGLGAMYAMLWI